MSSASSPRPSTASSSSVAGFGTNEWLVEEMYQQYLADPDSVDAAWHEFFADYKPAVEVAPVAAAPALRIVAPAAGATVALVVIGGLAAAKAGSSDD